MESIKAISFRIDEVGKHVKGSKKRFIWEVVLNSKHHILSLDYSFISGKIKIAVDNKVLYENELPSNVSFQYPFVLDGFSLNIIQQGDSFELRINNKVFSHLYNQHRTNTEFKKYEDQVKDIKTQNFAGDAKVITLNIAGLKKKQGHNQAAGNWNNFGSQAFPNFFSQNTKVITPTSNNSNLLQDNTNKQIPKNVPSAQSTTQQFDFFNQKPKASVVNSNINFFDESPPSTLPMKQINSNIFATSAYPTKQTNLNANYYATSANQSKEPFTFEKGKVSKADDIFNLDTLLPPQNNPVPNSDIFNLDSHFPTSNANSFQQTAPINNMHMYNTSAQYNPNPVFNPAAFSTGVQYNNLNEQKITFNAPTFQKKQFTPQLQTNNIYQINQVNYQSNTLNVLPTQINAPNQSFINTNDFTTLQMLYSTNQGLPTSNQSTDFFAGGFEGNKSQFQNIEVKNNQPNKSSIDLFELANLQ